MGLLTFFVPLLRRNRRECEFVHSNFPHSNFVTSTSWLPMMIMMNRGVTMKKEQQSISRDSHGTSSSSSDTGSSSDRLWKEIQKQTNENRKLKNQHQQRDLQQQQYYGGANGYNVYNYNWGGGGAGGAEGENWWLGGYSIKVVACLQGEQSINYERGEIESSTVIFRLCPTSSSCGINNNNNNNNNGGNTNTNNTQQSLLGCTEGYGEYSVGINTFAEAFAESIRDNYQYYDLSQMADYMRECRMFEGYNNQGGGGGAGGYWYGGGYGSYSWIGPTCTADGTNIRLGAFSDPVRNPNVLLKTCLGAVFLMSPFRQCRQTRCKLDFILMSMRFSSLFLKQYCTDEISFGSMYNGATLPYSTQGILPSTSCMSCYSQNYDNYEWEINQMCHKTYEDAPQRCEKRMDFSSSSSSSSYYGGYGGYGYNTHYQSNYGCDFLDQKVNSILGGGNGLSLTSYGGNSGSSELRNIVVMFLAVASVSTAVVLLFVRHKRGQQGHNSLSKDGHENGGQFELMDPKEAISDAVRAGSTTTLGAVKNATKHVRQSIHESAKRLVDMTRSSSSPKKSNNDNDCYANDEDTVPPMTENEDFVIT